MSLVPGRNFGNYEIMRLLGRGGMGEVYLAKDKNLKRPVAIKILTGELVEHSDQLRRFRKEASFAAALNHPNICTIYETGEIEGLTYICMEYVEGDTLRHYIPKSMSITEVLDIAVQIADALDEAHKKNVIHRDIKSSNILLTSRKLVKILDFGLAKQLPRFEGPNLSDGSTDSVLTAPGSGLKGTTSYMSPEAILGKRVDHRSDIFSFGVLLYEMLAGRLPFSGDSAVEVLDAIMHKEPAPVSRYNDKVPDALLHVLRKMLEKDPEKRYQSIHEVWIDLRRIKEESFRIDSVTGLEAPKVRRLSSRNLAALIAVIVAFSMLGLYFIRQRHSTSELPASTIEKKTLAVIPFQYSGDAEYKYFGTLVTDALIAGLESEPGLVIAPYATVKDYEKASIQDISRELGVRWIVRGQVSTRDSDLVIKPEMLSSDGSTVWSQPISGPADRFVSTLEAMKNSLLAKLEFEGKSSAKAIDRLRTPDMDAYKYYVQARNLQEKWDQEENLEGAIASYRKSIEIDPDFAAAHAGLAQALVSQYLNLRTPSLLVEATAEAKKAITQDPDLPESLIANGLVQLETGNSVEARIAFARALELAPGNDAACRSIAAAQENLGRHAEAKQMYERAIALRPNYWRNHYTLGRFYYFALGNFDDARLHLSKAHELYPDGSAPLVVLGLLDLARGELAGAEASFRKVLEHGPDLYAQSNLGVIYYYQGKYDLAVRNWQTLLQDAPDDPLNQANLADTYRAMGEYGKAREHYILSIQGFRTALASNPEDFFSRAGLAMAMSAIERCEEAREVIRNVLSQQSKSPELAAYAAVTATRCGDTKWATQLVLDAIAGKNLRDIRFHPDLEIIRQVPEVKRALANRKLEVQAVGES